MSTGAAGEEKGLTFTMPFESPGPSNMQARALEKAVAGGRASLAALAMPTGDQPAIVPRRRR